MRHRAAAVCLAGPSQSPRPGQPGRAGLAAASPDLGLGAAVVPDDMQSETTHTRPGQQVSSDP